MSDDIVIDPAWVPSACTLPTAEQPLRVAEFDALFAETVQAIERPEPGLLRLELVYEAATAARAAELAARENGCCSFFTFTLTIADGTLTLEVRVPAGHIQVLQALHERARTAATGGAA
ncbi:hypothetical protein ACIBF6_32310 [Streptosporangium amethystogenes]|uniref:hypothetical protein n=1 Tax=Streptosporangium amethystogenes TaxID=2002 RepID=UPI0037B9EB1C